MSDRVKSNSMQDVFHAAGNSANIDFGKYAPKDKVNPLGAREMADVIKALVDSDYNTGKYPTDYKYEEKALARMNINAASNGVPITVTSETPLVILNDIAGRILNYKGTIIPVRAGSGDATSENVRDFLTRRAVNLNVHRGICVASGKALFDYFKNYWGSGATYDEKELTITFPSTISPLNNNGYIGPISGYKANTRYTAIFTLKRSNTTGRSTGFRFEYTHSGFLNFEYLEQPYNAKQTIVSQTEANKTLNYVRRTTQTDNTTYVLYCKESGIYEGAITSAQIEPFDGKVALIKPGTADDAIYGGEVDLKNGTYKPFKVYEEYAGEELVGEWLCNKAEYSALSTPPNGSVVVDLGAYDEPYEFETPLPFESYEPISISVDRFVNVEVEYEADANKLLQNLLERVEELEEDYDAIDARVTALENPPAQTTEANPTNSTLVIDRPEINTLDPAISTPDVEPTEPTENT